MKLKVFIAVFISSICLLFPYNIIGCAGGDADPYDYFVSFFHPDASGDSEHKAFLYTDFRFLYDANDEPDASRATSAEWSGYAVNKFSPNEAYQFVCEYSLKDINSLYYHIEKKQALKIPDSVKSNGMTQYFLGQKDLEALGYLIYAKKVEPFVVGGWNSWDMPERDTAKMSGMIKNGLQLYSVAKNDFVKLRYAYQVVRLARYTNRLQDCIKWYNELVQPNKTVSVLQDFSLALKAGAMRYSGQRHEAAFLFSQLFMSNRVKKISNFMSFEFSVDKFNQEDRAKTLAFAKTNIEKANVLALFSIGNNKSSMSTLKEIRELDPSSKILPALITREINKLEEHVLTPYLKQSLDKNNRFVGYTEVDMQSDEYKVWQKQSVELSSFCKALATRTVKRGFYFIAAAYTSFIAGDLMNAKVLLEQAKSQGLTPMEKDQWQLTQLLITINSTNAIDDKFEKELMPSVSWMALKAKTDPSYAKFYRRLFADILAAKYKQGNDKNSVKNILCSGVADQINTDYVTDGYGYYPQTLFTLRRLASPQEVEGLIRLLESKNMNEFEQFMVKHSSFNRNDVNDIAGTAWLRQYKFEEAEKWFKKVPTSYYKAEPFKTYLAANPFADLLLDTHQPTKQDTVVYTKLSFTQKMMKLEKEAGSSADKEKKAKTLYELAKGYYQMSYWGNSWLLSEYSWSSSDTGEEDDSASLGKKSNPDYYLVNKSKEYYLLASKTSGNPNFQARCIYMAAKCEQKRFSGMPYLYEESAAYRTRLKDWISKFDLNTKYYTTLQTQYANTPFFKEAFNTCSYLQDFVKGRK